MLPEENGISEIRELWNSHFHAGRTTAGARPSEPAGHVAVVRRAREVDGVTPTSARDRQRVAEWILVAKHQLPFSILFYLLEDAGRECVVIEASVTRRFTNCPDLRQLERNRPKHESQREARSVERYDCVQRCESELSNSQVILSG